MSVSFKSLWARFQSLRPNSRMAVYLVLGLMGAFGLAYASVPFYQAFCQMTGIGGATRRAEKAPTAQEVSKIAPHVVRVHFDSNTHGLAWSFKPEQPYLDTRVGKTAMMVFTVKNTSDHPITARATYNVLPDTMGPYFMKIQCFCFTDQTLKAGESKSFPVVYFLDPKLLEDEDTKSTPDVTLSYTFFESKSEKN